MQTFKKYQCSRCKFEKQIKTNHYDLCWSSGHFNCCEKCPPWAKFPEYGGVTIWICQEKNE